MAQELKITARIEYSPSVSGMQSVDTEAIEQFVDMTGSDYVSITQNIGIAVEEYLDITSDIGTLGYVLIKNLDSTNFVQVGLTGSYPIKIKAGEVALFRAGGDLYAKADTSAVDIQLFGFED